MTLGGLAFGLFAERRPFGDDMLAHPLLVYFIAGVVGLLALRSCCAADPGNFARRA